MLGVNFIYVMRKLLPWPFAPPILTSMPNMMQRKFQKTYSFFSTVADKIGQNVVYDPSIHPSIVEIKDHVDIDNNFDFQNITTES
jgi:hypothetical protein